MKLFQSQITCMYNQSIHTSVASGIPSEAYPNAGGYCYHDFIEIELFTEGRGIHYINGVPYNVKKGYFYLLMPGDFHYYSLDESTFFCLNNIKIAADLPNPAIMKKLSTFPRPHALCLEGEDFDMMRRETELLHSYCTAESSEDFLARNIAERIILLLIRNLEHSGQHIYEHFPKPIRTIIDYVSGHYRDEITSEDMAALTGLTPHYFSSYFRKHTGIVFREYVNRVRLSRSIDLLVNTGLSIQEIADAAGFSSQSYFTRLFSKQFGMSPRDYRLNRNQ